MTIPLALIFEDDPKLKIVFEKALQLAGFTTEVVLDGLQAKSRISGTPRLWSCSICIYLTFQGRRF